MALSWFRRATRFVAPRPAVAALRRRFRRRWQWFDKVMSVRLRVETLEGRTMPAAFTVLNTADSGPGSFRQAILDANAAPGADVIDFALSPIAPMTISPTSALPELTDAVTIDGWSQSGYSGVPLIELDGTGAGVAHGLNFVPGSAGSIVRGLVINNFQAGPGADIVINADDVSVQGCYIGTNAAGTGAQLRSAPYGVMVLADNAIIGTDGDGVNDAFEGNLISGNHYGIAVFSPAAGTVIAGNRIGTNATGIGTVPNTISGVHVFHTDVADTRIGTDGDGQSDALEGNVIAGNGDGIVTHGRRTVIAGNYLGTNATGLAALGGGNVTAGAGAVGTRVGTNTDGLNDAAEGNVIAGNIGYGVQVQGPDTTDTVIAGNLIGLGADGTTPLPNTQYGVWVRGGAVGTVIGGRVAAARNVISANTGPGVEIDDPGMLPGTVSWWEADGSAGDPISGNTGALQGDATYAAGVAGGQAFSFDGAGDAVLLGNPSSLQLSGALTIDAWVNTADLAENQVAAILSKWGNDVAEDSYALSLRKRLGNLELIGTIGVAGDSDAGFAGGTLQPNAWYHVAMTYDAATGQNRLYVNGVEVAARVRAGGTHTSNIPAYIGRAHAAGFERWFSGQIDDAAVYGRALTAAEVQTIAAIGGRAKGRTVVEGNLIGADAAGTQDRGNTGPGVMLRGSASGNLIGGTAAGAGNRIVGNGGYGVDVFFVHNTRIEGNVIGLGASGAALGNGGGVSVAGEHNRVGGGAAGARNVISGNDGIGVIVGGAATGTRVQGNYIGLSPDGTTAVSNTGAPVSIYEAATGNYLGTDGDGSDDATEGNVIAGNGGFVVAIHGVGTDDNVVAGNRIGTNAAGTADFSNGWGVYVFGGARDTRIGTDADGVSDAAEGNLISGNNIGVYLAGPGGNVVAGNRIGTNAAGTAALGNGTGVYLLDTPGNRIGGLTAAERNLVSGNANGVVIDGSTAIGNLVRGNYVGTDLTGTVDLGNAQDGIIVNNASGNLIGGPGAGEGNLVSGNDGRGIVLAGAGATGNFVLGNFVGTNAAGTADLGNTFDGILISVGDGNTIGGTAAGAGNLVSGNDRYGISLRAGANSNDVRGNYVGTDVTGTVDLGNSLMGVTVQGSVNTIAGNLVSGNNSWGVEFTGSSTANNLLTGNKVGTTATGNAALPNGHGVLVEAGANNNTIGGRAAVARNLISGNAGTAVFLTGAGTTGNAVEGNYIGTNAAGTAAVPNDTGVAISVGATGNTIGGLTGTPGSPAPGTGAGNVIAGNLSYQILLNADGNTVQGNLVGLGADGSTAIDATRSGIVVGNGVNNILFGGSDVRARNVIGGLAIAFYFGTGSGTRILNNYVGTDVTGTLNRGSISYLYGTTDLTIGEAGAGNVWVGSTSSSLYGYGDRWSIQGNRFGTTADGTAPLLSATGLSIYSSTDVTVGGAAAGEGNQFGDFMDLYAVTGGTVQGNTFGLNAAGTAVLAGSSARMRLYRSGGFTVGGSAASARNVFASTAPYAVAVAGFGSDGTEIRGNYFGTNAAGTAALGSFQYPVYVAASAANTTIDGNVIAGGSTAGVWIDGTGVPEYATAWFQASGSFGNSTGYQVGGTPVGTVGFGAGVSGQAFQFSRATPGRVESEHPTYTRYASSVSVEGWVNPATLPAVGEEYWIAGNGDADNPNTALVLFRDGPGDLRLAFRYLSTAGQRFLVSDPLALTAGAFRHVALTSDGVDVKFYLDGSLHSTTAFHGPAAVNYNPVAGDPSITLYIGGGNGATNRTFDGRIDELAVYDRALTAAEVARIHGIGGADKGGSWTRNTILTGNTIGLLADGTTAGNVTGDGVLIDGSESNTVGGTTAAARNVISKAGGAGVHLTGTYARFNTVLGNYIGTDATGELGLGNVVGVHIASASGNTIGGTTAAARNVISGNSGVGVNLAGTSTGNVVLGNYIGTDKDGTSAVANVYGVQISGLSGNTVGGTAAGAGNVISGNLGYGVVFLNTIGSGNTVRGNLIGLQADGDAPLGNGDAGVALHGAVNNTIAGNVLSANSNGVWVVASAGTVIQGNLIGTDVTGTRDRGNTNGVFVEEGSTGTVIGGLTAAARNVISGNDGPGVYITDAGTTGTLVQGNYIGTDVAGTADLGNAGHGVHVIASGNTVGGATAEARNVISGNGGFGVALDGSGNVVLGNYIGVDVTGNAALGNTSAGVVLNAANTVGGVTATAGTGAGNVISANAMGVSIAGPAASGSLLRGNVVGLGADGATDLGNATYGVYIHNSQNVTVGGSVAGAGNVISGNDFYGIFVTADGLVFQGNYVGTDRTGTLARANVPHGLVSFGANAVIGGLTATPGTGPGNVFSGNGSPTGGTNLIIGGSNSVAQGNIIGLNASGTGLVSGATPNQIGAAFHFGVNSTLGGTVAGSRNVISGNTAYGVLTGAGATDNFIQGNSIGTDITGTVGLGNAYAGVYLTSRNDTVGGTAPGAGNVIAHNAVGVTVDGPAAVGNALRQNLVYFNAAGQIVLANGGNANQPAPNVTGALAGATTRIFGGFAADPNRDYQLEFFASSALGQARRFLGAVTVTTDAAGVATIDHVFAAATVVGEFVTGTATTLGAVRNTSALAAGGGVALAAIRGVPARAVEGTPVTLNGLSADPGVGGTLGYSWSVTKDGLPVTLPAGTATDEATFTFTPPDEGSYTVNLLVTTGAGVAGTPVTATFTAANVAPAVEINGLPSSATPGALFALSGVANDPGAADALTYAWAVTRDGTPFALPPGTVTNAANFAFNAAGNGIYVVRLTVNDGDGGVNTRAAAVVVSGDAPAATIDVPATGTEGHPIHAAAALADVLAGDVFDYAWTVTKNGAPYRAGVESSFDFTPDDEGSYIVRLRLTRDAGTPAEQTFDAPPKTVTVANVAPEAEVRVLTDMPTAGQLVELRATADDRGTADVLSYEWTVIDGLGATVATGTTANLSFRPVEAGTFVALLTVRDGDGGVATAAEAIDVAATGLVVTIGGLPMGGTTEGTSWTLTPSVADPAGATFRYAWTVTKNGDPYAALATPPGTFTATPLALPFQPNDNGRYVIALTVVASDGRVGAARAAVTVTNVAPTVSVAADAGPYHEGTPISLTGTASDPARADTLSYAWSVTRNGAPFALPAGTATNLPAFTFVPTDDGAYVATLTVRDDDMPAGAPGASASRSLTVGNVAPQVAVVSGPGASADGRTLGFRTRVTDPGTEIFDHTWSVTLDGGPLPMPAGTATNGETFVFTRTDAGVYVVTVQVSDRDGGVTTVDSLVLAGDAGDDTISVTPTTPGIAGVDQVIVQTLGGDDRVTVDAAVALPAVIDGGEGDDTLAGGSGDDVIFAGPGHNVLTGGRGRDLFIGGGSDTMAGNEDDDTYRVHFSTVDLTELPGEGRDTIDLSDVRFTVGGAPAGITFDLGLQDTPQLVNQAASPGSTLAIHGAFEVAIGTWGADKLTSGVAGSQLYGGEGTDSLVAASASDVTLFGGEGNDSLVAQAGSDVTLFGGEGSDSLVAAGASDVTLYGGEGADSLVAQAGADITLFGGEGNDSLVAANANGITLYGGEGGDYVSVTGGNGVALMGGDGARVGDEVTLYGGSGNDSLVAEAGADVTLYGGDGADSLVAAGASDVTLYGGEGSDSLVAQAGADITLFGGEGTDSLVAAGASDVTLYGGEGTDSLVAQAGADITLYGGEGNDSLVAQAGADVTLYGGEGSDSLVAAGASDVTLYGGEGSDSLVAQAGSDVTLFGGEGNDSLVAASLGTGITLFGGEGNDSLVAEAGSNVTLFGGEGADSLVAAGASDVTLYGGEGSDSLVAQAGADVTLFGGEGNDSLVAAGASDVTLYGGEGSDSLVAQAGADVTLFGGEGNDSLVAAGASDVTLYGGEGSDSLVAQAGSDVTLFGGEGNDSLVAQAGADITLYGGEGSDSLVAAGGSNVTLFGGEGTDSLVAQAGVDVTLFGGEGNDSLVAAGASDVTLFGGENDDSLVAQAGANVTLFGDSGNDSLIVTGGSNVTVYGGEGHDSLVAAGGSDVTLFGGEGNDSLVAQAGVDVTLFGGEGADSLVAAGARDVTLYGGEGNDSLIAQAGSEITLFGGEGNDLLTAQAGNIVTLVGEGGDDTLLATSGSHLTFFGGLDDDSLVAASGGANITLFGNGGDDTFVGQAGTDVTLSGGSGADKFDVTGGSRVTLFGDSGLDTVVAAGGAQVRAFGGSEADELTVRGGADVTLFGGSGDDSLTATGGVDAALLGESGDDRLTADGADGVTLFGGRGDDTLDAGAGAGVVLLGDDGDDTYAFAAGAPTAASVKEILTAAVTDDEHASRGSDTLDLSAYFHVAVSLNLLGSDVDPDFHRQAVAGGFTLVIFGAFENVIGTDGDDRIEGSAAANRLDGRGGADTLLGLAGDDTLAGGAGSDLMTGGTGDDAYEFAGTDQGNDVVEELYAGPADLSSDTLDFAAYTGPVVIDLRSTAAQPQGAGLTVRLTDGLGVENVIGTALGDALTGNARDNIFAGGAGDDAHAGLAGDDTYVFGAGVLGRDTVTEAPNADSDTLDFSELSGPLDLDLAATAEQTLGAGRLRLTLSDGAGLENAVGTAFGDRIVGNARDNTLTGAGGPDRLDGRGGADTIQGGVTQVVLLDFATGFDPLTGDHDYTAAERNAVQARLETIFAGFTFTFTQDPAAARALTRGTGRQFVTLAFNSGPGGDIGGEAHELDFGNTRRGGRAEINVNGLLGGLGQPEAVEANFVALSATIAAHEVGHLAGLRHADAFGPIGSGIYAGVDADRYRPAYTGPAGAVETPRHLMGSPPSVGTSVADALAPTFLGERELLKLTFADSGVLLLEAAGAKGDAARAQALGELPALAVANSMPAGQQHSGATFAVAAVAVNGTIEADPTRPAAGSPGRFRSEDDWYTFSGRAGDLMNFEVISAALDPRPDNPIDSVIWLYGPDGTLLATNDDEFETTDSALIDVVLPADGVYTMVVDTYAGTFDEDIGSYQLFLYRFAATSADAVGTATVPTPGTASGDTLVGGAGSDTLVGSTGDDEFLALGATTNDHDAIHGNTGYDTLDLAGAPALAYTADGLEEVIESNHLPTLAAVGTLTVEEGGTLSYLPTADAGDPVDSLTFTLAADPNATDPFPTGMTVDAATGRLSWTPIDDGAFAALLTVTDAGGLSASRPVRIVVTNAAPVIAPLAPGMADGTGAFTRTGTFSDAGVADSWTGRVDYGTGSGWQPLTVTGTGFTLNHAYAADGTYHVAVEIADGDGGVGATSFDMTVRAAPTASIVAPAGAVRGQDRRFLFQATSPSADVQAEGYTYTVNWGDGSPVVTVPRTPGNAAGVSLSHTFAAEGDVTVTLTATDRHGHSSTRSVTVAVKVAELQDDPTLGRVLVVGGGTGNDTLLVAKNPADANRLIVWVDDRNVLETPYLDQYSRPIDRIIAYGQAGNDWIGVGLGVSIPVEVYAGAGNDIVAGGNGHDILVGGDGDDLLFGGTGRDLLIGGAGRDRLWGNSDDDILVAGVTDFDSAPAALRAVMAEWTSGRSYDQRVRNLRDGSGSVRLNGSTLLNGSTVHDDGAQDTLAGEQGRDWFLFNQDGDGSADARDRVLDQAPNEWLTDLDR